MEDMFKGFASFIALGVESVAALIIAFGAIEATYAISRSFVKAQFQTGVRKRIWLRFAMWLLLGLEFELAADIIRTAISPS